MFVAQNVCFSTSFVRRRNDWATWRPRANAYVNETPAPTICGQRCMECLALRVCRHRELIWSVSKPRVCNCRDLRYSLWEPVLKLPGLRGGKSYERWKLNSRKGSQVQRAAIMVQRVLRDRLSETPLPVAGDRRSLGNHERVMTGGQSTDEVVKRLWISLEWTAVEVRDKKCSESLRAACIPNAMEELRVSIPRVHCFVWE